MKQGLSLAALAGLQLTAALASQLFVLRIVGAGAQTDAFVIAQTLPLLVVAIFATPMQAIWLPRLSIAVKEPKNWQRQQSVAQGQMMWLMVGTTLPLALAAPYWLVWLFPGLTTAVQLLTTDMTRILLVGALFNAHALLLTTAMRSREKFILPELVSASTAIVALAAVPWVVARFGVLGASWIAAARSGVTYLVLFNLTGRAVPEISLVIRDEAPWRTLRPLLAGASLYKLSPLVDRYWGSLAAGGGLTLLALSQTGIGALAQMLERAVSMPAASRVAQLVQRREHAALWILVSHNIWRVALLSAGVGVTLVAAQPWWNEALHSLLAISVNSANQMWWVCLLLLGYLCVSAAGGLPVTAFLALGDSRTPVLISSVAFVIGVALKSIGFIFGGLPGLALATSVYYIGNLSVVCCLLRKRLHDELT